MEDYYDQDIMTRYKCPRCGGKIWSHSDCTLSCDSCNFMSKTDWKGMEKFKKEKEQDDKTDGRIS